jgi:hypothetical protein|tara:strand:- start:223 stop:366 length:144 start_codon:yes stop_codon:yes gene_type:complete
MRYEVIDLNTDKVIKSFSNYEKAFNFQAKIEDETGWLCGLREVPDDV